MVNDGNTHKAISISNNFYVTQSGNVGGSGANLGGSFSGGFSGTGSGTFTGTGNFTTLTVSKSTSLSGTATLNNNDICSYGGNSGESGWLATIDSKGIVYDGNYSMSQLH